MKKLLLSAVASAAVLTMSAEPTLAWQNNANGIFNAKDIDYTSKIAIDSEGSVIATGIYNQDATIEGTALDAVGNSSYIIKYTADGKAAWTVGLIGSATISQIATDSKNNIFVAGQFADEVAFGTTSGDAIFKTGMVVDGDATVEQNAAFIAKYTADGKVETVCTLIPEIQPALKPLIDDWGAAIFYWYTDGDIRFKITDLKVANDNVYVGAMYTGITKFDDLTFDASYVKFCEFMYCDNISATVFSLDNSLKGAKIVDEIVSSVKNGDNTDATYEAWEAHLAIDGDNMAIAYTGIGGLSYRGETISIPLENPEDDVPPYFLFSLFKNGQFVAKKIVESANATFNNFNSISALEIFNGYVYAAGNKYNMTLVTEDTGTGEGDGTGESAKPTKVYSNNLFTATIPSFDLDAFTMKTDLASDDVYYYLATNAAITAKGEIYFPTRAYYLKGENGHKNSELAGIGTTFTYSNDAFATTEYNAADVAVKGSNIAMSQIAETGATFALYKDNSSAGIEDIVVDENAPVEYFNLQGVRVNNPAAGSIVIRRQGESVSKVLVK